MLQYQGTGKKRNTWSPMTDGVGWTSKAKGQCVICILPFGPCHQAPPCSVSSKSWVWASEVFWSWGLYWGLFWLKCALDSWVRLSRNHQLEKAMAPRSSTLAWKIPWMEKSGGLQFMGSLRVGHYWSNLAAAAGIISMISSIMWDTVMTY